jgi:hypothetical protein
MRVTVTLIPAAVAYLNIFSLMLLNASNPKMVFSH